MSRGSSLNLTTHTQSAWQRPLVKLQSHYQLRSHSLSLSALVRFGPRPHAQQEDVAEEIAARAVPTENKDAASERDRCVEGARGGVLAAHREVAPPPPLQVEEVQRRVGHRVG
ncbi:hypothetical protein T492DRAFT_100164 [Pavlovales sp. CCMP2436]|nr:hypothetical protein T492DRAFT_100164 [Pavlovales sp. CCMP2436]